MKKYLKWSLIVPILFLIGGGLWLKNALTLGQSSGLGAFISRTGPGTFPAVVLSIMIICSAVVTVQEFLKIRKTENVEEDAPGWKDILRVILLLLALLAYILVMPKLGFIASTIILMALCMVLFEEKNILLLVLIPIVASVAIFFLFTKVLYVPLPTGILF